jgi:hypothetical protein
MCTLSFIPINTNSFIITSNRDENVNRKSALPPAEYNINANTVVYPKDGEAGGTWIAVSSNNITLCLLNGAFNRHERVLPYKHSRGLIILHYLNYQNLTDFITHYDFTNIEPFTLVIVEHKSQLQVTELRWDGTILHKKEIDAQQPQIWSSASLYTEEIRENRKLWFKTFLKENPKPNTNDMLNFHLFGGNGNNQNSILMNRNNVLKTISITSIAVDGVVAHVLYNDIEANQTYNSELKLNNNK